MKTCSKGEEDEAGEDEAAGDGDGELPAWRCGCMAAEDSSVEENIDEFLGSYWDLYEDKRYPYTCTVRLDNRHPQARRFQTHSVLY